MNIERFEFQGKWGIKNIDKNEELTPPFADWIYSNGIYQIGDEIGAIDLTTGEIIETESYKEPHEILKWFERICQKKQSKCYLTDLQ